MQQEFPAQGCDVKVIQLDFRSRRQTKYPTPSVVRDPLHRTASDPLPTGNPEFASRQQIK